MITQAFPSQSILQKPLQLKQWSLKTQELITKSLHIIKKTDKTEYIYVATTVTDVTHT